MEQYSEIISVIVPVYKVEKFLPRCLESIINQTYKNLEIILIDDGSPDLCGKICDEYAKKDSRIKVIHKENAGVSAARNDGIKLATGDYITFVDSDDWVELNMYENMLKKAKEEKVDVVRCSYFKEYENETILADSVYQKSERIDMKDNRKKILENLISGRMHAYLWLLLIKKECVDKISDFNANIAMREDFLWGIELFSVIDSMYVLKESYYHYFQNSNSVTNSYEMKRRNMENMLIVSTELKKILEKYNMYSDAFKEVYATCFLSRVSSDLAIILFNNKSAETLEYVINNKVFNDIILSANYNKLSLVNKIFFYLYKKQMKRTLYRYCVFREYIRIKFVKRA